MKLIIQISIFLFFCGNFWGQENHKILPYKNVNGKWMMMTLEGNSVNGIEYDSVSFFENTNYFTKVNISGKWGVINNLGVTIVPVAFDSIRHVRPNYHAHQYFIASVKENNDSDLYGLYLHDGQEVLPPNFRQIEVFKKWDYDPELESPISAQLMDTNSSGSWGLYTFKGEQLLEHEYSAIQPVLDLKNKKILCFFVTKRNIENQLSNGVYNALNKKWIVPCLKKIEIFNLGQITLANISSYQLLTKETYLTIPTGYLKDGKKYNSRKFDYYNLQGDLIYQSVDYVDYSNNNRIFYYVLGDSIIGKTNVPGISNLCDSTHLKILNFGETDAIFNTNTGFVLEPGAYKFINDDACKYGYVEFRRVKDEESIGFGFDGKKWDHENQPVTPEMTHVNGNLIVRNENGQPINMTPYSVKCTVDLKEEFGDCFIAQVGAKCGIINREKEIIYPFEYDRINYFYLTGLVNTKQGKYETVIDKNLNKVFSTNNKKWNVLDYYGLNLVVAEGRFKTKVYDLDKRQYTLKGIRSASKKQQDSMRVYDQHATSEIHQLDDSSTILQIFDKKEGWTFYSQIGEKIASSKIKYFHAMHPLIFQNEFLGFMHPFSETTDYISQNSVAKKYHFLNGLRFENMDSVNRIQFYPVGQKYLVYFNQEQYIYDVDGSFVNKYEYIQELESGLFFVQSSEGFNVCDSNFKELLPHSYKKLNKGFEPVFVAETQISGKSEYEIIFIGDKLRISDRYKDIQHFYGRCYFGFTSSSTFDVLNQNAEVILRNCSDLENYLDYFVFKSNGREYWISPRGTIYASHEIKK